MAVHTAPDRAQLSSSRAFTWYTPTGKAPTEYEDLTVDQQSSPEHYAFQGWPIRFDDGRDPYAATTTEARSSDWYAYRDPNQTIQRSYISSANESEKSLERSIAGARAAGLFGFANRGWIDTGLAQYYMTYPFLDYGMFLALCYAEREALSDTATFSIVFSAADKLRHLQDVVYYSFVLREEYAGFSDDDAPERWRSDPAWQGARAAIEDAIACEDWVEVVVAVHVCLDRIFGELTRVEYFSRFAAANGDIVTPILIASAEADAARTQRWVGSLLTHLLVDPLHGEHNHRLVDGWLARWNAAAERAADTFRPAFDLAPVRPSSFEDALRRVQEKQSAYLAPLGLTAPKPTFTSQPRGQAHV